MTVVTVQGNERKTAMNTALSEYINKKDSSYGWEIRGLEKHSGMSRIIHVELVSQFWQPDGLVVDEPLWRHRMTIYVPEQRNNHLGILHVNGGIIHPVNKIVGNDPVDDLDFIALAQSTGSVVVDLKDVPNQYLAFDGERPRKEDDLVARTWEAFLQNPRNCPDCLLQFPMSKAVVRGMDAVEAILKDQSLVSEGFILSGGSKRGWAVWLTAAVDNRVKAIVPGVIDVLNVQKSLEHLHDVYGYWVPPLQAYREKGQNVIAKLQSSAMNIMMKQADPWYFKEYLTIPKYVLTASGDDFFPPDASRFYWADLPGTKWLRTYPNARHYIIRDNPKEVTNTIASFAGAVASGKKLPEVDGRDLSVNGGRVSMYGTPKQARLWQVTNPNARDFRVTTLKPAGLEYKPTTLSPKCSNQNGRCELDIKIENSASGWTAWFAEFVFSNAPYPDFVVTTPVKVTPDIYPAKK